MDESEAYILELREEVEQSIKSMRDLGHCLQMFGDIFEESWEDKTEYAASFLRILSLYVRQAVLELEEKAKIREKRTEQVKE